jgi:phosphatidylserine/phosphatidylglycerophosphate/cardiolipin synthase-like enzyme
MLQLLTNKAIYEKLILEGIPGAKQFVWIGTSDLKDMYISKNGSMQPFLGVLAAMIERRVQVRLIHAKEPGPNFRRDFDRFPVLFGGLERMLCSRVHFKIVIIDGKLAYTGSANLTGAGMGAKNDDSRNFENGILTDEPVMVEKLMEQFDGVWRGDFCKKCRKKEYCQDGPMK